MSGAYNNYPHISEPCVSFIFHDVNRTCITMASLGNSLDKKNGGLGKLGFAHKVL